MRRFWIVFAGVLLPAALCAQESRGTIVGRVIDANGGVLRGVAVQASNVATGVVSSTTTNAEGLYRLPYLNPGLYQVSFARDGFRRLVKDQVELRVADELAVDATLAVGQVSEELVVTAEQAPLDSTSASLGQVVDLKRIEELPMREGNPMELVLLAPGIANTTDLRMRKSGMTHSQSQFDTDGSGEKRSDFTIDGVPNTSNYNGNNGITVAYAPPASSVQEFRVQTATYDASIGNTVGAVVNVVTKSGTNALHGEVHYWYRDSKLDSNDVFSERAGFEKRDYDDKRFGFALGGPIVPDRSFFFVAFEGNPYTIPDTQGNVTVPTQKMRNGDFSELLALGPQYQLYDPLTTRLDPNDPTKLLRSPFVGNILPPDRISPAAKKLLNYYPMPNVPADANLGHNYRAPSFFETQDYYTVTSRFDHSFSPVHRIYARASLDWWQNVKNDTFANEATGSAEKRRNRVFALDDTYAFSGSMVLNARVGYTRQAFPVGSEEEGFDIASLGFTPSTVSLYSADTATFPRVSVNALPNLGTSIDLVDYTTRIWSASATLTWLKGSHTFRFGPELRIYDEDELRIQTGPSVDFQNGWTVGPYTNSTAAPYGQGFANLLLGYPTGGSMALRPERHERIIRTGVYLQDDWKPVSKLTLNLGVRYEYEEPVTERNDGMINGFDFETPLPIQAEAQGNFAKSTAALMPAGYQLLVHGGMLYAAEGGRDRLLHKRIFTNVMPRVGFAYELDTKTVVRGGYGLFYDSLSLGRVNVRQPGFSRTTNVVASVDNGRSFQATLDNPYPSGLLQPVGPALGLMTDVGSNVGFTYGDDVQAPRSHRFSLGFQRQLPLDVVLDVNYVGSRSERLPVTRQLNAVPRQYQSTLPTRDQANNDYLTASVPNPFYGINATFGSTLTGKNVNREQLLRPYPQFANIETQQTVGKRWYDAAQLRLERRFRNGYTFQVSYSYSRMTDATSFLNETDPMPEKVVSAQDHPHVLALSGIFELPFGKGRAFGHNWSGVTERLLGGWQIGAAYNWQSGTPIGFGNFLLKPGYTLDDVKKPTMSQDELFAGLDPTVTRTNTWFDIEPFERTNSLQLTRNLRTQPTRFADFRRPGYALLNGSLLKNVALGGDWKLQLRLEGYNLLNTINLGGPNTTVTSGDFGTISALNGFPRQFQLAAVLKF